MDAIKELSIFKKKADAEIEKYFSRVIAETEKRDPVTTDALRYARKLIFAGGKRLRPALMYYGYVAAGGKELEKALKTSISIELIHTFLLIHDDIIDRDGMRHGIDSVNLRYKKISERIFGVKDGNHFGNSMAIIIGDMICALGNQIIFESGFAPELIMKALSKLQDIVSYTVIGQASDMYIEYRKKATEKEILSMYEYKTAKYTIEGPLHLGAILGGADEKFTRALTDFSIPIGIAFQIQDDVLGIFGSEKKLGKKIGSDITGGKYTILVAKAMKNATKDQHKFLDQVLGNKNITKKDIQKFKEVMKETGAYDYAKSLSQELVQNGKRALEQIKMKREAKDFLAGIAEYMTSREL